MVLDYYVYLLLGTRYGIEVNLSDVSRGLEWGQALGLGLRAPDLQQTSKGIHRLPIPTPPRAVVLWNHTLHFIVTGFGP